jgi:hypothetical protein
MSCLVYCILSSHGAWPPRFPAGVDGCPVTLVEAKGLGAAVSLGVAGAAGESPGISRLLAYERVVETFDRQGAVLPMRYGCVLAGEAEVKALLGENHRCYGAALKELEGRTELGVRIALEEGRTGAQKRGRPSVPLSSGGKDYLNQRRRHYAAADGSSRRRKAAGERCRAALAGLFVRCKAEGPTAAHPLFNRPLLSLYFLVEREKVEAFVQAFHTLAQKVEEKMLLSGPWPPYNFVPQKGGTGG